MYIELEDLRSYLGIETDEVTDDDLLTGAIEDAQAYIESQTNRRFESNSETRYYLRGALDPDNKFLLLVDHDLLSVSTLTNGDSGGTAIPNTEYVLWPRNYTPYWGILLETDSTYSWEWDTDYYVQVAGTWGYSSTPPGDIVRACTVLAAYFYKQKDAQVFDTTAIPEAGVITIPQGIPATVTRVIERYKRYL